MQGINSKIMLQVTYIKENKQQIVQGLEKRRLKNAGALIEEVLQLDADRRKTQANLDQVLAEANSISKEIGALMKAGKQEEATAAKDKTATLKSQSKSLGEALSLLEENLQKLLYNIPNVPHESVPEGGGAEDNENIYEWGNIPDLKGEVLPHWELIKKYDIIDFDLGNKITGAGFPVYKGKGARLQRALVNFFLDQALEAGFVEVQPPIVVNQDSGYATGQLPDKEGQMYHIGNEDFYLIPTAEVPITNLYRDVLLQENDLPIRHVGFTPCFRREAGSWGAHVRGLNRLHQFDKVEIVEIHKPEDSYKALERMRLYIQGLLEKLGLPYRVLRLCGGDMGFTSALTYDMEVFSAAQKMWLEVSSVSNFETYQANRLKLRYKPDEGAGKQQKTQLLHTLNGSALALPRILAAILENYQTGEGITIPEILKPYTGFDKID